MKRSEKRKLQSKILKYITGNDIEAQLIREQIENEMLKYDIELFSIMIETIREEIRDENIKVDNKYTWLHSLLRKAEERLDEKI